MEAVKAKPVQYNEHLGDWETFYKDHIALVYNVVNEFKERLKTNWELDMEDLVSVGTIGLLKAYINYKPDYNTAFSTYAVPTIRGELFKMFRDFHPRGIKVSRYVRKVYGLIKKKNLESLSDEEIARILDTQEELVKEAKFLFKKSIISKDQYNKTEDGELLVESVLLTSDDYSKVYVEEFLNLLTEREREIIKLRMKGKSQEEIGKIVGLSQTQISRILQRKIKPKLERYLKGLDIKEQSVVS